MNAKQLSTIRYEFLLFALLMLIFNKVLIPNEGFYLKYVWPANMVILGLASINLFRLRNRLLRVINRTMIFVSVISPLLASQIFDSSVLSMIVVLVYLINYLWLFVELIRQITLNPTPNLSVVLGSLCGYLLLIVIAVFSFLLLELQQPASFSNTSMDNIPLFYNEIAYFSIITITSTGFGDILPLTDSSRLLAGFWALTGQIYLITIVGIIISKFTGKQ